MLFSFLNFRWNYTLSRFLSNRRRRLLNGTDYLKSKSGYAGRYLSLRIMDKVRCAHLLLKHRESRNPVNRNTGAAVTRSKQEAVDEMRGLLEALRRAERPDHEFRRLATAKSECSSAKNGGDLGFFDRYTMQKPFTEASFKLKVNEISDLVETDSGVHLIYRIA